MAGQRWTVEESFQSAKGLTGLDQYQLRNWTSWHRSDADPVEPQRIPATADRLDPGATASARAHPDLVHLAPTTSETSPTIPSKTQVNATMNPIYGCSTRSLSCT